MSAAYGAWTQLHRHSGGHDCLAAAGARRRNTTIVIGADQKNGTLLLDIDVQADVCSGVVELRKQLQLVIDALDGAPLDGDA